MERHYIIASHESMADGISKTLKFIIGNQPNITVLTAYVDNQPIEATVKKMFDKIPAGDEVIVFTDLLAGSVNQKFFPYTKREHTHIITGMNLPILMSLFMEPKDKYISADRIRHLIKEAQEQIQYVNDFSAEDDDDDE